MRFITMVMPFILPKGSGEDYVMHLCPPPLAVSTPCTVIPGPRSPPTATLLCPQLAVSGGWALVLAEPKRQAGFWRLYSLSPGPHPWPCMLTL